MLSFSPFVSFKFPSFWLLSWSNFWFLSVSLFTNILQAQTPQIIYFCFWVIFILLLFLSYSPFIHCTNFLLLKLWASSLAKLSKTFRWFLSAESKHSIFICTLKVFSLMNLIFFLFKRISSLFFFIFFDHAKEFEVCIFSSFYFKLILFFSELAGGKKKIQQNIIWKEVKIKQTNKTKSKTILIYSNWFFIWHADK